MSTDATDGPCKSERQALKIASEELAAAQKELSQLTLTEGSDGQELPALDPTRATAARKRVAAATKSMQDAQAALRDCQALHGRD
jgi:hypothetical protein